MRLGRSVWEGREHVVSVLGCVYGEEAWQVRHIVTREARVQGGEVAGKRIVVRKRERRVL